MGSNFPSTKSAAAQRVTRLVGEMGAPAMARRLLITRQAVEMHAHGGRSPRGEARRAYEIEFGIPPEDWERPAKPPKPKAPSKAPPPPPAALAAPPAGESPTDSLPRVLRLLDTVEKQIDAAIADDEVPYSARAALIQSARGLTQLLSRLTGSLEVTQAMICRSSAWGRILRAFETVFDRHPEAQQALAEFAKELAEMGE